MHSFIMWALRILMLPVYQKRHFLKKIQNTQFTAARPTLFFPSEIISGEVECKLIKA